MSAPMFLASAAPIGVLAQSSEPSSASWLTTAFAKPVLETARTPAAAGRRRRLWEIDASLHCSIIGTCLSMGDLRPLICKSGFDTAPNATDYEIHSAVVRGAGRHDGLCKQIQKTLDRRHQLAIKRFARARGAEDLGVFWRDATREGDIPGPYWALLTHGSLTDDLLRSAFGHVHMLSHLVGAANRVDICRLHDLESAKAALEQKVERLQTHVAGAIASRDARMEELQARLDAATSAGMGSRSTPGHGEEEIAALHETIAALRRELEFERRRAARSEGREKGLSDALAALRDQEATAQNALTAALAELKTTEQALQSLACEAGPDARLAADGRLDGATVLYVGGRSRQAAHYRSLIERASGRLLYHDGGIEENIELLPGLVSRADIAVFPVDCVSHGAALLLKKTCGQLGKPFVPLRSAGLGSLLHALRGAGVGRLAVESAEAC